MKLVVEKVLNSVIVYTPVYCLSSNFSFKKKTLSLPSPTSTCFVSLPHVSLPSFLPFIVKMCSGCGNYCSPKWMLIESSFNLLTEFFFFFSQRNSWITSARLKTLGNIVYFLWPIPKMNMSWCSVLLYLRWVSWWCPHHNSWKVAPPPKKTSWTLFSVFNKDAFRSLGCKVFSFGQSELQQMVGTLKTRSLAWGYNLVYCYLIALNTKEIG